MRVGPKPNVSFERYQQGAEAMGGIGLILVFMAFVSAGEIVAITAGVLLDSVSENTAILVFFALSVLAVTAAWPLALRVTERD
jgi:membrane protein implicated in regulation of membrane protease activity